MSRMTFESDADALIILKHNIKEVRNGVLKIPPGYDPTQTEWDAIHYLIDEWDFTYERD